MEEQNLETKKPKKKKVVLPIVISCIVGIALICGAIFAYRYAEEVKRNTMPNVVGMDVYQAVELLEEKDWVCEKNYIYVKDKNIAKNEVAGQSIACDTVVKSDEKRVTLEICCGYMYDSLPRVKGENIEEAEKLIKELSSTFVIKKEYEALKDETIEDGTVYNVYYSGDLIDGRQITLYIKHGTIKTLPSVVNISKENAIKIIEEAGMSYKIYEIYSEKIPKGNVISINDDTYVTGQNETFELTVSKGPDTRINIPKVSGLTETEAVQKLKDAGCNVKIVYTYTDVSNVDCRKSEGVWVSKQDISGKTEETKPTVTLTVKKPSIIIDYVNWDINSVGGVDVKLGITNKSNKQIKYVVLTLAFYDRVGGKAYCDISGDYIDSAKYTGPLNAGASAKNLEASALIYNSRVAVIRPVSAEVTFSDNTVQKINFTKRYWYGKDFYGGDIDW